MPHQRFSVNASTPTVDLVVDTGNPLLNSTVNGFLKVGPVGAAHVATQEAFKMFQKERVTKPDLEKMVKKAGKEGLQWGVVAGIYAGMEYGTYRVRGCEQDWKNAALGGALTGCVLSLGDKHFDKNKMIRTAITGGAIATANELLRYIA